MLDTVQNPYGRDAIASKKLELFQGIVDLLAEMLSIPAALIMRVDGPEIEVFCSSKSEYNPYKVGDSERYIGSGLYCETVVKTEKQLLVPNALADPNWANNPDIKQNMVSYLGLPIMRPDGKVFGTICVLDSKANAYNSTYVKLLEKLRSLIESSLVEVFAQQEISQRDDFLRQVSRIYPICSYCKHIRVDDGNWILVEDYIHKHVGHLASHGICPECLAREFPAG